MSIRVRLKFKLADLWVGAYFENRRADYHLMEAGNVWEELHIWVCLLPCFPIHIVIPWRIG